MIKQLCITLLLLPSLAFCKTQTPRYSHVIFFGDSLSDIGNMPESPKLIEPAYKQIALNLFVPISNPIVDPDVKTYTVVGSHHKHAYPKPAPQPQPPLQDGKTQDQRRIKSLNWTQYFTENAKEAGLLSSAEVWPWFWWKTHSNDSTHLSINYAWSGAVTDNGCRDFMYNHLNNTCSESSILAGQKAYRQAGFFPKNHTSVSAVQVPGVERQINLFLQDSAHNHHLADANTLYVILVGGNDLNLSLFDLKKHHILSGFSRALGGASRRVWAGIETLINQRGARHIVLFNLFDTSQLPYLQTEIWKTGLVPIKQKSNFIRFSHLMTQTYNLQLRHVVEDIARRYNHHVDIQLFNLYNTMNEAQQLDTFSSDRTLYQTCIGSATDKPISYYTKLHSCTLGDARYLFWNGAHPSSFLHQIIADKLTTQLSNAIALSDKLSHQLRRSKSPRPKRTLPSPQG